MYEIISYFSLKIKELLEYHRWIHSLCARLVSYATTTKLPWLPFLRT